MANLEALRALGVDPEEGVAYCAGDPEFYMEMLGEFVSGAPAASAELKRLFDRRDWAGYGIRAHSLKSTSRMIGAASLSEAARALEMAAKEGRPEEILSKHGALIDEYAQLVSGIRGISIG